MNTIETLNLLLKTCRDGQEGFRACAAAVSDHELRDLLRRRADDCAGAAEDLKTLVARHGGRADDGTSLPGDIHRGWMLAADALAGTSDRAILAQCEVGEDVTLADYRFALTQDLPFDARQTIEQQLRGAQRNHDQIRALRDAHTGAPVTDLARLPESGATAAAPLAVADRALLWSLAQVRLHPVRSLGVLALIGLVGWCAMSPRPRELAGRLRRLR
jgi:uncharacterized protein (TIGR02284 family)